jgi:ribose transport system substrate-binding protein
MTQHPDRTDQPLSRIRPPRRAHVRRLAAVVIVPVLAVALAACSSGSSSGGTKSAKDAHIAFVYDTTDSNFAQEMALGAKAAAKSTGVTLNASAPPAAVGSQQVQLFQAAERTSTDGIALATLFPDLFVRPFTDAKKLNIPLIAVDAPPAKGAPVTFFIGNDNFKLGVALANAMLSKIPTGVSGEILIGTDTPGLPVLTQRNEGFKSVIKAKRPGVTFVEFNSTQAPTTNFNAWSAAVSAHPTALAFVGPGSQDAASLAQIEKKTGKKLVVGAADLDPIALQGVKSGYVTALASPEHWLKGYLAVALLAEKATKGKKLPSGWWNPGDLVVNSANVDEIIDRQSSEAKRTAYFTKEAKAQLANPSKYLKPLSDIE